MPPLAKIDPEQIYPCPCARRGRLQPIALTDAFGCDRCPSMYELSADHCTLIQVGALDPYRQAWHWSGNRWQSVYPYDLASDRLLLPLNLAVLLVGASLLVLLILGWDATVSLPIALVLATSSLLVLCWLFLLRR